MTNLNYLLQGIGTGETVRDFRHASKIFVDNNYELAPKYQFSYYVFFDISDDAKRNSIILNATKLKQIEAGILVKAIDLPKFRMDFKTYNAYNRKDYVQTKVNYEPILVTLHDDTANVVRDLWRAYYNYYFRDMDYALKDGQYSPAYDLNKYNERIAETWGYGPAVANSLQFFRSIKIYSMSQKQYSLYTLINPKIESFEHGRHDYAQGAGTMEHTMRLNYQAVNYDSGFVSEAGEPKGMTDRYDNQPSPLTPIGGGTRSITGQGGLIDDISAITSGLEQGNIGEAAMVALRASQNFKGYNFKAGATEEATSTVNQILRNSANSGGPYGVPQIKSALKLAPGTSNLLAEASPLGGLLATSNGSSVGG